LTLGNYIGAMRNWLALQDDHTCLFMLVDLHAVTVRQDPTTFADRCYDFMALYAASGLDPQKCALFIQSHVPQHAELAWILNCYTQMGELSRMTQFKDKSEQHKHNINAGLFGYPVLMAADILLYDTSLVPVGADQKQHLELARDVAERFNGLYSNIFKIPEPYIPAIGARVMSLQDPLRKMDKSDPNDSNVIGLLDTPEQIVKKLKRAVTDSDGQIVARDDKPGVTNLLGMLSAMTGESIADLEARFSGKGYGHLKSELAEVTVNFVRPLQERYRAIRADLPALRAMLRSGAEAAAARAALTLRRVHGALGFVPR
jgi:tryptophanyl-tRNA synthetase